MRAAHLTYLRCPMCHSQLGLCEAGYSRGDYVETGRLTCASCETSFPIAHHIPRFVRDEGYTDSFGLQWTLHARTQFDSVTRSSLSETRFVRQTGWSGDLAGETVIEAGSGAGRFTSPLLATDAIVLSVDYSRAVDSNYAFNGHHPNLLLVQGDLCHLPFELNGADKLLCFGVLQHTQDPFGALSRLTAHVRPGGAVAVDIYAKTVARYFLGTKYWVRPVTRRLPPELLHTAVERYVSALWPLTRQLSRIPKVGKALNWRLLVADHSDVLDDDGILKEWAILDTFDMLAPRYDNPARARTLQRWARQLGLTNITVEPGPNGFELTATRGW